VGLFSSQENVTAATCRTQGDILKWSEKDWIIDRHGVFVTMPLVQGAYCFSKEKTAHNVF
jgi:hypothetical protein